MIILVLIFSAPIVQIILSILRIGKRITLPLSWIAALTFISGLVLSYYAMILAEPRPLPVAPRCSPESFILLGGIISTTISTPIIGIVSYIAYRIKQKNDQQLLTPGH